MSASPRARSCAVAAALLLAAAALSASPLVLDDLRIHPAIREGELTLFPLALVGSPPPLADFLLLDEGLAAGTVVITEIGGAEEEVQEQHDLEDQVQVQSQVQVQVQQVSGSGAQVNRLALTNSSDRPLLLIAGEMVRGARQDRIIAADVVIPAGSSVDNLEVFCVESGRWVSESAEFRSAQAVSGAEIRKAAQLEQSQRAVWDKVSKYNDAVGATSDTQSLNAAYDKPEVREQMAAAQGRLEAALARIPELCGAVIAVGGRIVVADIFSSPQLFRRLQEKLLAGYLLDALSAAAGGPPPPDEAEVRRYLADMLSAPRVSARLTGELQVEQFQAPSSRGIRTSWRGVELHVSGY